MEAQKKTKRTPFILRRWVFLASVLVIGLVLFFILGRGFIFTPAVTAITPANSSDIPLETPIVVDFSRPVERQTLAASITPDVEGTWQYEESLTGRHFFRRIRFVPTHTFTPETTYAVHLDHVQSPFHLGDTSSVTFSFTTRSLPDVASVSPKDGTKRIAPTTDITVQLAEPNPDIAEFEFLLDPAVTVEEQLNDERDTYTLVPSEPLQQGTAYHLSVYRVGVARDLTTREVVHRSEATLEFDGTFKTIAPPRVATAEPTGSHVFVDTPMTITFTKAMDLDSLRASLSIDPDLTTDVTLSENGKTATITPTRALAYGSKHTVTVDTGTETRAGGYLEEPVVFSFTTIGHVAVAHASPKNGDTGVGVRSGLQVTFDQQVDRASAEAHVALDPATPIAFRWDGNTLHIQPTSDLQHNATYTLRVASGIASVHGLDLDHNVNIAFATEPDTVKLAIGSDLQDRPLSCEAAALKMALAGKGVFVSESDIMAYVGYDPTPHVGDTWGDPYTAFVGDIDGRQNTTGYGVYWGPIATAANHWRPAEAFTGWAVQDVTAEISKGNPVVVWGVYGSGYRDSWTTPSGKSIYAWKGEHARTVIGYVGSAEDPSQLILNDPYAGQIYWSRSRFEQDWGIFGNAGVVVR